MIGYLLGATGLGLALWLGDGVGRIGAVSSGRPIGQRSGAALVLIDLQTVFWNNGPYSGAAREEAQSAILGEVTAAKAAGHPIIALRQEWSILSTRCLARLTMRGQAIAGTPGTEIAEPFAGIADHILVKPVQDGFQSGELDRLLARLEVGQVRLVGLDLNYCVLKTALAARKRGYEVSIPLRATLAAGPTDGTRKRLASQSVVLQ
ncbi:cysteine hydrolase [Frigidibacter sp. RF13]|uniref:cysteine hydrolase family protein n=1 Tax=Frigidibacter sp. RF13 TaxID=2997340 RepID=UPI0022706C19|nr:isochorismatase family cysteine hydrolase [Frigidibacter sp. RF13]MCY1127998.1 cysteine hydrolase [Frigidibacter sp. RF13]